VRRTDPGDPDKCPVWQLHQVYSDDATREWASAGCRSASIGCLQCKAPVIEAVLAELAPLQARAREFESQPDVVRTIIAEGCDAARDAARETLEDVREAMGLDYR
jgi:tryptophanyl-tRNA synthetase